MRTYIVIVIAKVADKALIKITLDNRKVMFTPDGVTFWDGLTYDVHGVKWAIEQMRVTLKLRRIPADLYYTLKNIISPNHLKTLPDGVTPYNITYTDGTITIKKLKGDNIAWL